MTIYDQLVQIASDKAPDGYLSCYRDDLFVHDQQTLRSPKAARYLWILRECGSELFPVAAGYDAIWATYWLKQGNMRDVPSLAYLLTIATGAVKPITYDRAERLAALPHPDGLKVRVTLFGATV